jgi:hypothetical protein
MGRRSTTRVSAIGQIDNGVLSGSRRIPQNASRRYTSLHSNTG